MNKKLTVILAGIFISVLSIPTIPEAQTMKSGDLNAKQEKIVTIAAFTANGDLQKLKTALNEGLDALCCDLLNANPREVLHIQLAHESRMGQMNLPAGAIKHLRL